MRCPDAFGKDDFWLVQVQSSSESGPGQSCCGTVVTCFGDSGCNSVGLFCEV